MIDLKILASGFALMVATSLCAPLNVLAQEEETAPAAVTVPNQETGSQSARDSGKEVILRDSGKEIVAESTKEGAPAQGIGNYARSPFHISVSVREGYDDNVYTTKLNPVGSWFTNGAVQLDYRFGSPRTQFDVEAVAGASYYYYRPFGQDYDINTGLTLSLEHHATPRLILSAKAYLTYQTEPDLNNNFGVNRRAGNYFYTNDKFTINYQWAPRFATATSYTFGAINYDDPGISAYEDRFEHTFGNEFRFLVLPTTTLVGEYRFQIVDYDTATRDSTTHFVLAGIDHTFNPRFNFSLRAGGEFREIENFGERTSPYAESTLRYALSQRTSLSWTNRYGLEEPDTIGTPSRTTYRTGLALSYGITPRIAATGSLFYQHDNNDGITTATFFVPPFNEDTLNIGIGLRYEINRVFAVIAGYDHSEVFSDILLREYSRNRYYIGLNATL